jgi:hypothetical protein
MSAANPTPKPTFSAIDRAWISPLSYSWLRLQRDWRLVREHDHLVGEEPADSWLVLVLRSLHWFANAISPWEWINFAVIGLVHSAPWLRSKDRIKARYWVGDWYVTITTAIVVLLTAQASHIGPDQHLLRAAVMAFFIWRLFEIYRNFLRFVVIDYIGAGYPHTTISAIRYLMYIPLYAVQIIFMFAVIYMWLPNPFYAVGLPALHGITSFIYVSATTITSLNSNYTPATRTAEVWVAFESLTGLVLFGLGISTFLGGLKLPRHHQREE